VSLYDFFVAVDLGQAADFTAIAIAEAPVWIGSPPVFDHSALWPPDRQGWVSVADLTPYQLEHFRALNVTQGHPPRGPLHLRHLERMRHVSYQVIVDRVKALLTRPPLSGAYVALLIDRTGVGRAVGDMMVAAGLDPFGITIHGGDAIQNAS
jgi:hypothetical protein